MPFTPSPDASVCAVVVTRDRRELLRECLTAIAAQSRPAQHVVVVDNASSDGTAAMVREEFPAVELLALESNGGGAGGFHAGMGHAHAASHDWLWLMDDDTIPTASALEALLEPLRDLNGLAPPMILASRVEWTDGRLHPKNFPLPRLDEHDNRSFLDAVGRGLLAIRLASFVSILVHREAIDRYGLPHRHYFIWGDDGEYTARVLKEQVGYTVPGSVVRHKTSGLESVHEDTTGNYYFEVRNKLLQMRSGSFTSREKIHLAIATAMGIRRYLAHNQLRPRALAVLVRALRDGLRQPADSA